MSSGTHEIAPPKNEAPPSTGVAIVGLMCRLSGPLNCGFSSRLLASLPATARQSASAGSSVPPARPVKPFVVFATCRSLRSDTEPAGPIELADGVTHA